MKRQSNSRMRMVRTTSLVILKSLDQYSRVDTRPSAIAINFSIESISSFISIFKFSIFVKVFLVFPMWFSLTLLRSLCGSILVAL